MSEAQEVYAALQAFLRDMGSPADSERQPGDAMVRSVQPLFPRCWGKAWSRAWPEMPWDRLVSTVKAIITNRYLCHQGTNSFLIFLCLNGRGASKASGQ